MTAYPRMRIVVRRLMARLARWADGPQPRDVAEHWRTRGSRGTWLG